MRTCLSPVLKGDYEELHLVGLNYYADAGVHLMDHGNSSMLFHKL